jgi:hypothetical protein
MTQINEAASKYYEWSERKMNERANKEWDLWRYDCGWRIASNNGVPSNNHPYRECRLDGFQMISQPVGLLDFYKDTGFLPTRFEREVALDWNGNRLRKP